MKQILYEIFPGDQVTDAMLDDAAKLFSENYGIWGEQSHKPGNKQPPLTSFLLLNSNSTQENALYSIHADSENKSSPIRQHAALSE